MAAVTHLLQQGLCYTDFKLNNLMCHRDAAAGPVLRLADVDGIGCVRVVVDFDAMQNRVATFPLLGGQHLLGYPVCDLLQTWYSATVVLFLYKADPHTTKQLRRLVYTKFLRSPADLVFVHQVFWSKHPLLRFLRNTMACPDPRLAIAVNTVMHACAHSDIQLRSTDRIDLVRIRVLLLGSLGVLQAPTLSDTL